MENSIINSMKNPDLNENKELNCQNNFIKLLSISLIFDKVSQFIDEDDIKCLSSCSKKLRLSYCKQIKKIKLCRRSNTPKYIKKYVNLIELNLEGCKTIKDFSFISELDNLEVLNLRDAEISDISFLEKNKNLKKLNLSQECYSQSIGDFSFISKLEKLEDLNLSGSELSDISFLEKNINIKI